MPRKRTGGKRGRPTTFDAEKANQIISILKTGVYLETAAMFSGTSRTTMRDWLKRGRDDRRAGRRTSLRAKFSAQVEEVIATWEAEGFAIIGDASRDTICRRTIRKPDGTLIEEDYVAKPGDWRAAAWQLERRLRKKYGRTLNTTEVEAGKTMTQLILLATARDEDAKKKVREGAAYEPSSADEFEALISDYEDLDGDKAR